MDTTSLLLVCVSLSPSSSTHSTCLKRCQAFLFTLLLLSVCFLLFVVPPSHLIRHLAKWTSVNRDDFASNAQTELGKKQGLMTRLVRKYRVDFDATLAPEETRSPWEVAADWVNEKEILPEDAPELGAVLNALTTYPIMAVGNSFEGTQLKLILTLDGGQTVIFKPKWYERDFILEGSPSGGRDRHNGEVAAFQLSRVLEFRRSPVAVGRFISLSTDLIPSVPADMLDTFYQKDGETCFYGHCQNCSKENALCTQGDTFEGVIIMWLPQHVRLKQQRNPWRRSFQEKLLARWEKDEAYCRIVRQLQPFDNNGLLLDVMDVTVLDYLTGNGDRHSFDLVDTGGEGRGRGMLVMLDNGKSFGNPYQDERSLLAPLYQCCSIRLSTWHRLRLLQGGVLSSVLREVLRDDPLQPVLTEHHLQALDRRLHKVLQEIDQCIDINGLQSVLVSEGTEVTEQ